MITKLTSVKIRNLAYPGCDFCANIAKLLFVMVKQLSHRERQYSKFLNRPFSLKITVNCQQYSKKSRLPPLFFLPMPRSSLLRLSRSFLNVIHVIRWALLKLKVRSFAVLRGKWIANGRLSRLSRCLPCKSSCIFFISGSGYLS